MSEEEEEDEDDKDDDVIQFFSSVFKELHPFVASSAAI